MLSHNPAAIHLLEKNLDKINWEWLSSNPGAIHLLEQNQDKIKWCYLLENPNTIHLFEQNQDKIDWNWLSGNPAIYTYNYENIEKDFILLRKAIIENRFHPNNIDKFNGWGFNIYDESDDD